MIDTECVLEPRIIFVFDLVSCSFLIYDLPPLIFFGVLTATGS